MLSTIILSAALAYPQTTPELKRQWLVIETECRGGDHLPNDPTCRARDGLVKELERRGWCWAYRDMRVAPPDYDWHPCAQARPKGWRP